MNALAIKTDRAEAADYDDAHESDINSTPVFSDRQAAALYGRRRTYGGFCSAV